MEGPAAGDGAWRTAISGQHQRVGCVEGGAVASALVPPVGSGIDHWVTLGLGVVGVGEIFDPGDHCCLAKAVAGGARRIILDIEHTREGSSITGPPTSVGEEVVGLGGAGAAAWVGKVVATAD